MGWGGEETAGGGRGLGKKCQYPTDRRDSQCSSSYLFRLLGRTPSDKIYTLVNCSSTNIIKVSSLCQLIQKLPKVAKIDKGLTFKKKMPQLEIRKYFR